MSEPVTPTATFPVNAPSVADLVVSESVTHVIDFSSSPVFNVAGDLRNAGTIYAVSTNPDVSTATISASNIFNYPGAMITTVLPTGGLVGYENALPNLNLVLTAINNVVNAGTIASAGSLTVSAGGSITNALPPEASVAPAIMSAVNNLNLYSNQVLNSGLIAAQTGNVNIATSENLLVNSTGGVIQALAGAINIRDELFQTKANTTMLGGG